jgi:uncharacterized repeat protein (TIGR01451 family)
MRFQRKIAAPGQNHTANHWSRFTSALLLVLVLYLPPKAALGAGTTAGTVILNHATVNYAMGADNYMETSNSTSTIVSEVLDATLDWQDASPVSVSAGSFGQVLTFRLTNTGNGNEAFRLDNQNLLGGDDFDPAPSGPGIYLDVNGNDTYEPGTDDPYSPGVNDPDLAADASRTIFIVSDIPTGQTVGATGDSRLEAVAVSGGSGTPGVLHANAGDGGIHAVDGSSGGRAEALGTYVLSNVGVALVKSALVTDPAGGTQPVTGATITYTIQVTVSGSGSAQNLIIADPIPTNTTYIPSSLRLDAVDLTDTVDGDAGDVSATTPGVVTVKLGSVPAGSPARAIEFKVTID